MRLTRATRANRQERVATRRMRLTAATPGSRAGGLIVTAVLVVLAGLLGGCSAAPTVGATGYVQGAGTVTVLPVGQRGAPRDFSATTLAGAPFSLASTRGHVTVVNVWASWCPPCRAEAPGLQAVWQQFASSGVRFVGIDTRDQVPQAKAYQAHFKLTFPSVSDNDGSVLLAFRDTLPPVAIPSTLILDRSGRVAVRVVGGVTETRLSDLLRQVLGEGS